jgi:hypothetical protein
MPWLRCQCQCHSRCFCAYDSNAASAIHSHSLPRISASLCLEAPKRGRAPFLGGAMIASAPPASECSRHFISHSTSSALSMRLLITRGHHRINTTGLTTRCEPPSLRQLHANHHSKHLSNSARDTCRCSSTDAQPQSEAFKRRGETHFPCSSLVLS